MKSDLQLIFLQPIDFMFIFEISFSHPENPHRHDIKVMLVEAKVIERTEGKVKYVMDK